MDLLPNNVTYHSMRERDVRVSLTDGREVMNESNCVWRKYRHVVYTRQVHWVDISVVHVVTSKQIKYRHEYDHRYLTCSVCTVCVSLSGKFELQLLFSAWHKTQITNDLLLNRAISPFFHWWIELYSALRHSASKDMSSSYGLDVVLSALKLISLSHTRVL